VPLILVVLVIGRGVSALGIDIVYTRDLFYYGLVSLVLVYSAYVAEVYRAGIESIHASQVEAARTLGLSHGQSLRHVVVPQAVRRRHPAAPERLHRPPEGHRARVADRRRRVARQAQSYGAITFNFTGYTVAAIYFVLLTIPLARFTDYLVERDRRRMRALGG